VTAGSARAEAKLGYINSDRIFAEYKGVEDAKKHLIRVPLVGSTIPHDVRHDFGASHVLLRPAAAGTGVIAGGSVRAVVEVAGIRDLLSKTMGSTNPVNVVRATIEALASLRSADEIALRRGKTAEQLIGKRAAEAARQPHVYVERPQQMPLPGGPRGR